MVDRCGKFTVRATRIVTVLILIFCLTFPMYARAAYNREDIPVYIYGTEEEATFSCIFTDDVPVPYISVSQYLGDAFNIVFSIDVLEDGIYRYSNDKGYMLFNPNTDKIVIGNMEMLVYNTSQSSDSVAAEGADEDSEESEAVIYGGAEYLSDVREAQIDLSRYGIDIIEQDGEIYLPITTLQIITGGIGSILAFAKGAISFSTGSIDPRVDTSETYNNNTRNPLEADYTYRQLSLFMDTAYGCPPKCALSNDIKAMGFDAAMDMTDDTRMVKQLIKSEDTVDFFFGISILSEMLYDGGHTSLIGPLEENSNKDAVGTYYKTRMFDDSDYRTQLLNKWSSIRFRQEEDSSRIANYMDGYKEYTPFFIEYNDDTTIKYAYFEYDDTGIFVFSQFESNTIKYFRQALDLAAQHGMKNFLIDDSYNGGGQTGYLCYMLGILTGDTSLYYRGTFTDNLLADRYECDYNNDGVYGDVKEDAGYNFNYGVLCSAYSFSCGNILPTYAKAAGIPIIGETSGGGTCKVGFFPLPNTYMGQYSSYKTYTYKNGDNVENGATPDYDITKLTADGLVDYSDFHNFALLDFILDTHYSKQSPSNQTTQNEQATGVTTKVKKAPKTYDFFSFFK